jgi:DNA-binding Lrp family transcriptional regulator
MGFPKAVSDTFEKLKSRHRHLGISVINRKFYVSASTKRLVKATGAYKTFSLYMGRILDDGTFIEARHRKDGAGASSVEALIKSKTGPMGNGSGKAGLDDIDRYILESLSTDAKKSGIELARELGISATTVNYRIKKLENSLGIRYIAEMSTSAFGFSRFAVMVKFRGAAPNPAAIREELGKSPFVNVALLTKGSYDLFMIVVAENTLKLELLIYALRTSDAFSTYRSIWHVSYLGLRYGFIPLREKFFESLEGMKPYLSPK